MIIYSYTDKFWLMHPVLTGWPIRPTNGLIPIPIDDGLVAKGTRYIHRLFPEPVGICTKTSLLWSAGSTPLSWLCWKDEYFCRAPLALSLAAHCTSSASPFASEHVLLLQTQDSWLLIFFFFKTRMTTNANLGYSVAHWQDTIFTCTFFLLSIGLVPRFKLRSFREIARGMGLGTRLISTSTYMATVRKVSTSTYPIIKHWWMLEDHVLSSCPT